MALIEQTPEEDRLVADGATTSDLQELVTSIAPKMPTDIS